MIKKIIVYLVLTLLVSFVAASVSVQFDTASNSPPGTVINANVNEVKAPADNAEPSVAITASPPNNRFGMTGLPSTTAMNYAAKEEQPAKRNEVTVLKMPNLNSISNIPTTMSYTISIMICTDNPTEKMDEVTVLKMPTFTIGEMKSW